MSAFHAGAGNLHAPAGGDYRRHLYEARSLCHRTGWVALGEGGVTCPSCRRRLERTRARGTREWRRPWPALATLRGTRGRSTPPHLAAAE
jgi:hypothetical protein